MEILPIVSTQAGARSARTLPAITASQEVREKPSRVLSAPYVFKDTQDFKDVSHQFERWANPKKASTSIEAYLAHEQFWEKEAVKHALGVDVFI